MKIEEERFWFVWCPDRSAPTHKHYSRQAADEEANRLSTNNHGTPYYVLKAVGGVVSRSVKRDKIKMVNEEIPF